MTNSRLLPVLAASLLLCPIQPSWAQTPPPPAAPAKAQAGSGVITGRIKDKSGKPIVGLVVAVILLPSSGDVDPRKAITDKTGRFALRGLGDGEYLMLIGSPDNRYPSFIRNGTVILNATHRQAAVTLTHSPGALITGQVSDERSDALLEGVEVHAGMADENGDVTMFLQQATTDAQGRYKLRVPAGSVGVSVSSTVDGAKAYAVKQNKTLREGERVVVNLAVRVQPRLTFLGPDDKPVADASTFFIAKKSKPGVPSALVGKTNAQGQAPLDYFDTGYLRVRKGDLFVAAAFGRSPISGKFQVVTADQEFAARVGAVMLHLSAKAPAYLTGRVVGESGKPVANAILEIEARDQKSFDEREYNKVSTDAEGRFHLPLTLDDTYSLKVSADGYQALDVIATTARFSPRKGDNKDLGDIVLTRANGGTTPAP